MIKLGADYSKEYGKSILSISIIDCTSGFKFVTNEIIEDIKTEQEAIDKCFEIYKKYNCNRMYLSDNLYSGIYNRRCKNV
ncbi:hypothetical protein [Paraclostridium sordellii]|uniref:hypothetical protein n=1 Tax=Paraclostridium sordellii TaxID=1505 RepID=UPI0022E2223B|nr:hypothetical protein [Paeniclostridium sordellii]